MNRNSTSRLITIFTPSCADEGDTNAQNLTVKELVARWPADQFHITMIRQGTPDPRIGARPNVRLVQWTNRGNSLRLLRHCLFSRPDIYFFPRCGPLDRAFFDLRRRFHLRTALISYIVMMINDSSRGGLIGRVILEADLVCANSSYVAETVRREFGRDPMVMHDGVDKRFFFPRQARDKAGPLVVLYGGSFQPRKRVEAVIAQAACWPAVSFRLAGKGETEADCRQLCRELGCNNVEFLGHLTSAQLGNEMRKADVFLFPSILEGHPQVLIQAAACGLPSIAMNIYRPDSVKDGETGFLVQSDEELSQRLDLLLTNREVRCKMAEAAVQLAKRFDWDSIAAKWAELFRQVAASRGKLRTAESMASEGAHAN